MRSVCNFYPNFYDFNIETLALLFFKPPRLLTYIIAFLPVKFFVSWIPDWPLPGSELEQVTSPPSAAIPSPMEWAEGT